MSKRRYAGRLPRRLSAMWIRPFGTWVVAAVAVFLVTLQLTIGVSGASPLWGKLIPGPHAVGFRAIEKYDYSRTYQPKRDYFGAALPGERARPLQICMWYPGRPKAGAGPVVLNEYNFVTPEDAEFYQILGGLQNREIAVLFPALGNDMDAVLQALAIEMTAVKNADPAGGAFPLIIYQGDLNTGLVENAVMCEYLASHGFVVAAAQAPGPAALRSEPNASSLEIMAEDMGFVLAALRDFDFIDRARVGVLGYRAGSVAAMLLQMRNFDIDAAALVEYPLGDSEIGQAAARNPHYDVVRATVPLLFLYSAPEDDRDKAVLEPFKYSSRWWLRFGSPEVVGLTTYGLLPAAMIGGAAPPAEGSPRPAEGSPSPADTYEAACRYVLHFFAGHLNGSAESLAFLGRPPAENGLAPGLASAGKMDAVERPPTQDEFMAMLDQGKVDVATGLYEKFKSLDSATPFFAEAAMNVMGYRHLQRGMAQEAIAIFKMNADAHPGSANCWDSLAEAYMASGDSTHALECVQKVIEVLPNDTNLTENLRQAIQTNVEHYMQMLKPE